MNIMEIENIGPFLWEVITPLFNPQKRIFAGYLIASILMIFLYILISRKRFSTFFKTLFGKDIWFSKSAKLDYVIFLLNRMFMLSLAPILLTKLAVATYLFEEFHILFGGRPSLTGILPDWGLSLAFTFTIFLFDDASKYWIHRIMHRHPFLWNFHKIHHDAEKLTPFTVYRIHPVEALLFSLRAVLVQGTIIALFIFLFGSQVSLVDVFGANIFLFLFNITGSNLRHSHVWITYGDWFEKIFISPAQHQIHHSDNKTHFDKNFGVVLSVWDRMGNSLYLASQVKEPISFGNKGQSDKTHSLIYAYVTPIIKSVPFIRSTR